MGNTKNTVEKSGDRVISLTVAEDGFGFSMSAEEALGRAEAEIAALEDALPSPDKFTAGCDKTDYILAAGAGALCGIFDIFLVGDSGYSPFGKISDGWYEKAVIAFAGLCNPTNGNIKDLRSAIVSLERKFKVPYDQSGLHGAGREVLNLTPQNHHFKSLAHNPSLMGLFFSILDQFSNRSHFVTEGKMVILEKAGAGWELKGEGLAGKLFCGFVNWFGHLVSDMSGSGGSRGRGMGIPSPLWTWVNDVSVIKRNLSLPVSETEKALGNFAVEIFEKGYDARFQTAQAIPVLINELVVRFIYSARRLMACLLGAEGEKMSPALLWERCEPFSNPSVRRMLTVAHGTFCRVDLFGAAGRAVAAGENLKEFIIRLNLPGIGRFAVSLYGEAKREALYSRAKAEESFVRGEISVVRNYIECLKILSEKYDDARLLTFIDDLEREGYRSGALEKSVALARLRRVPEDRIMKNKDDIDRYFGGEKNG